MTIALHTLGCRLNQLETESIADAFKEAGFDIVRDSEAPDLVIINTCTVTSMAEQKGRRLIRQASRLGKRTCVIVTGCYAELGQKEIADLGDDIIVVPLSRKDLLLGLATYLAERDDGHESIPALVSSWRAEGSPAPRLTAESARFRFSPGDFEFHSRASIKIQDGCDNECTYCRVRFARGTAISIDAAEAVRRVRTLEEGGFREVVLSGINLAQYRSGSLDFPGLLALLISETDAISFRISSWEPESVDDRFLTIIENDRVRPFFHLAVQSLSDSVLIGMKRRYKAHRVAEAVRDLRAAKPGAFFGADVITGFPGETDEDFRITSETFDKLDFSWLHVFSFSPRPGTEAFSMKPRIPERITSERTRILSDLAHKKRTAFAEATAGVTVRAIVERDGYLFTEHSLKLKPVNPSILPAPRHEVTCSFVPGSYSHTSEKDFDSMGTALVFQ